ncbi:hypothetical protein Hanom_Chr17g01581581 [Helianthus anomalus]
MVLYLCISLYSINADCHGVSFRLPCGDPKSLGQANYSRFFVWITGFVLPWTHQESDANS